jgi:hypothetical protein
MSTGRPTSYDTETAEKICTWLSEGKSLRAFCGLKGNPSQSMVYRWLAEHEDFREKYARAREEQAETFADAVVHIADTESDAGIARVRIDARKWAAGKLAPKKYGDKNTTELTGADGAPLMAEPSNRDIARAIADILRTAKVEDAD